jgi:hypothetical protein
LFGSIRCAIAREAGSNSHTVAATIAAPRIPARAEVGGRYLGKPLGSLGGGTHNLSALNAPIRG